MTTNSAPNNQHGGGDGMKRYAIDVRVYLATVTAAMILAFGAGTMLLGPVPSSLVVPAPPASSNAEKDARQFHGKDEVTHVNFEDPSLEDLGDGAIQHAHTVPRNLTDRRDEKEDSDEEEYLPAGQHLLVDIEGIEADFLNSETRLSKAMVDTTNHAGLTLLSYHCHSLQPAGVSCVGVLLESHISFHTWPDEGVITLDLFTCGSNPLVSAVPVIEKLFGIPRINPETGLKEETRSVWSHELRGFRSVEDRKKHYLDGSSDLAYYVTSPLDVVVKKEIISTHSEYQRIDIWDILHVDDTPSHEDAMKAGLVDRGDPRWFKSDLASPVRMLFLDGALQSQSKFESIYHEALVQPAMFAHPNPTNVAIIGGGLGATLREVLKHSTVKSATMIEIDEELNNVAREYLPYMSDCSDLVGRAACCFDDEIANVIYEDGKEWFVDRYGPTATKAPPSERFDVILMDALEPDQEKTDISSLLYTDRNFISSLFASLSEEGVIAIQVGAAPSIHDPRPDLSVHARREEFFRLLEEEPSTAAMFVYEEAHSGFNEPRSFLVACKSVECRKRWRAGSDSIDFGIYERILPTVSEKPTLVNYDGSTHLSYSIPPKAWETVYCKREPKPFECDFVNLDPEEDMYDENFYKYLEVRNVTHPNTGKVYSGVFATEKIYYGSYIMSVDLASSLIISDESIASLKANTEVSGTGKVSVIEDFLSFVDDHGHRSSAAGSGAHLVEVGGSFLMRRSENASEVNIGKWMEDHPSGKEPPYSPVYERHRMSFDLFLKATRDIEVGDELVKPMDLWD